MRIKPFFIIFPVLVGAVIYAYYAPQQKPLRATMATPKQYIELVEERKAERLKKGHQQTSETTDQSTR